jgi:hypothetical protein
MGVRIIEIRRGEKEYGVVRSSKDFSPAGDNVTEEELKAALQERATYGGAT